MIGRAVAAGLTGLTAVAMVGCSPDAPADHRLDSLDNELVQAGNAHDPAVSAALHDQIMVDPALTAQANHDALRPPTQPYSGALPPTDIAAATAANQDSAAATAANQDSAAAAARATPASTSRDCPECAVRRTSLTLGALASGHRAISRRPGPDCTAGLHYSARWAVRLPADLPLYPGARVTEAAGNADNGCMLRAVSFSTAAPVTRVLDWYHARAVDSGYRAEHQADHGQHVLGGTRSRDGAAFVLFLTPHGGATDVDLIADHGQ